MGSIIHGNKNKRKFSISEVKFCLYIHETICCSIETIFKVSLPGNRELDESLGNGQVISSRWRRLCFTFIPINNSVSISGRLNYEETFLRS